MIEAAPGVRKMAALADSTVTPQRHLEGLQDAARRGPVQPRRRMYERSRFKRGASSHVPVAVLALALTDVTVDSLKASALFDLLAPPLHMARLGVVLP